METRALSYISYQEYLQTDRWRHIRWAMIWLAGGRCQLCGSELQLEVHHRDYSSLYHERPEDLTVLCRQCHGAYTADRVVGA